MFMQDSIEEISWQIGIQRARPASGRHRKHLYDAETFPCGLSGFTIELITSTNSIIANTFLKTFTVSLFTNYYNYIRQICIDVLIIKIYCKRRQSVLVQRKQFRYQCKTFVNVQSIVLVLSVLILHRTVVNSVVVHFKKILYNLCEQNDDNTTLLVLGNFCTFHKKFHTFIRSAEKFLIEVNAFLIVSPLNASCWNCNICSVLVLLAVFTVRALYAGTLVTCWTTAPSHRTRRSSSALLATFCLFLATLTIAARCYAFSNATHPLVQLSPQPRSYSSIDINSNIPQEFSKLVLSKLFTNPPKVVQSDTRIILTNSKKLLYNQNFKISNRTSLYAHFRTKRDYKTNNQGSAQKFFQNKSFIQNSAEYNVKDDKDISTTQTNEIPKYLPSNNNTSAPLNSDNTFRKVTTRTSKNALRKTKLVKDRTVLNLEKRSDVTVFSANNSEGAWNASAKNANVSRVSNTLQVVDHQNDRSFVVDDERPVPESGTERPMPPAHGHTNNSSASEWGVLVLVVSAVVLTVALGLVTCVLSHYRSSAEAGGTAADPHDAAQTPTTAPMLSVVSAGAAAGVGGMDRLRGRGAARELAATRDRQVRLHTVHTDIAINLPPSISMPDGEEHPFNSRLHIRDAEQESEIYQKCIRPPPNRTVLESESLPPYRSSSAGLLGSISGSSSGSSDWSGGNAPLVVRCHSMSSTSKRPEAGPSGQKTDFLQRTVKILTGKKSQPPNAPTLPVVIVPSRPKRTSEQQQQNSSGRPKPSV